MARGVIVRAGVLHTVPALVPVFHSLLTERDAGLDLVHTADPSLLARVVAEGVTEEVASSVRDHLTAMRESGAAAVLVTCSSIGEVAESAAAEVGIELARVDAPMAAAAVQRSRTGSGRILVLATLQATLGPTSRLVRSGAPEGDIGIVARVVEGAAEARSAGDLERHDRLIAAAIREAGAVDVIVLAQASMATGAGDDPRVMTSPESGAAAFVSLLGRLR